MALNQVAAELAECGRLRAPFRDAAHILLLDLDLDRPGKKGPIPSGLGLDLRSSKMNEERREESRGADSSVAAHLPLGLERRRFVPAGPCAAALPLRPRPG